MPQAPNLAFLRGASDGTVRGIAEKSFGPEEQRADLVVPGLCHLPPAAPPCHRMRLAHGPLGSDRAHVRQY